MKTVPDNVLKAVKELLQIDARHNRIISAMEQSSGRQLRRLRVNLLPACLDLLGVPPHNTRQRVKKYGSNGANGDKDTFCRDHFAGEWIDLVDHGSARQIAAYPKWVLAQLRISIKDDH